MPTKSQIKGKTFERDACRFLSDYFNDSFVRSKSSGARLGGQNVVNLCRYTDSQIKAADGDIHVPDDYNLSIECKHVAKFPFHKLLSDCVTLDGWLDQLSVSSGHNRKLVMFKVDRLGVFVCCDADITNNCVITSNYVRYKDRYIVCERESIFNDHNINTLKHYYQT